MSISWKRSALLWLPVLVLLSAAPYLVFNDDEHGRPAADSLSAAPDISLEGIRQTFIENGVKKWTLRAASACLSRDNHRTRVDDIEALFYTTDGRPVRVVADKGLLTLDAKDAEIFGHVVVHHPGCKISTEALRYQAGDHIIISKGRVRVEGDAFELNGDGLRYDLTTMTAVLTGNVTGIINNQTTTRPQPIK